MGTDMKSEQTDCSEEDIDVAYELLVTVTQKYKLRSSKDGTTNITWRIIYVCYFIVKFNIAVPKEFILNMIIFPEMFLRKINEKNADGEHWQIGSQNGATNMRWISQKRWRNLFLTSSILFAGTQITEK